MQITELEVFKNFFKEKFCNFNDKSYLIYVLILRKFEFNLEIIEKNRNLLLAKISERINLANKGKIEKKAEKLKLNKKEVCDPRWQNCIYDIESGYKVREFFIYKTNETPLISENHFDERMIKLNKIINSNFSINSLSGSNRKVNSKKFIDNNNYNHSASKELIKSSHSYDKKSKTTNVSNTNTPSHKRNSNDTTSINMDCYNFKDLLTDDTSNNIFDFSKKFKSKDNLYIENYSFNNYLIERRAHICEYKYEKSIKNNYEARCSICIYTNNEDYWDGGSQSTDDLNISYYKDSKNSEASDRTSAKKRMEYRSKSILLYKFIH